MRPIWQGAAKQARPVEAGGKEVPIQVLVTNIVIKRYVRGLYNIEHCNMIAYEHHIDAVDNVGQRIARRAECGAHDNVVKVRVDEYVYKVLIGMDDVHAGVVNKRVSMQDAETVRDRAANVPTTVVQINERGQECVLC